MIAFILGLVIGIAVPFIFMKYVLGPLLSKEDKLKIFQDVLLEYGFSLTKINNQN